MHPGTEANPSLVSYPVIAGKVIHGNQVGRTLGFPTANLDVTLDSDQLPPGVYTALVEVRPGDAPYTALAYFGPRFVNGESHNIFEVYLFNFSDDLYDLSIRVKLLHFQRAPVPFSSLDDLKKQLDLDKLNGEEYFATHDFPRSLA